MDGHYFVSYSRVDGAQFAGRLYNQLVGGRPSYPAWLDVHDAQPGTDWDAQIAEAIQTCRGLLFVMTPDSVQEHSVCKSEWVWALKYKKPVIPLRADGGGELPFRLSSREYVDFSHGFEIGLARLRSYLDSVGSPRWVLRELRDQLTEAERELPRADPERRPRIEQDIAELHKRIADQQGLVADPEGAARRTEERITAGLDQERHPERPQAPPARAKFVNAPPVAAPGYFQDRHVETELIADFLRAPDERIVTVVGRGGVGKTAMVCRLLKALEGGRLPDNLGELDVDGIVYLSPGGAHPVNFPNLFADLCRLLSQDDADRLMQRYRDPQQTPTALMRALLDAIPAGRVVVLLDQAEDFIDDSDPSFPITDAALDEALRTLLNAPVHGVKVILTTRVAPRGLLLAQPERQRRLELDSGLDSPYAEQVLRARDPHGRLGLKTAPEALLAQARQRTRGYPRALEALAAILAADRDTTLPELLAQTVGLPDNVVEVLVGQAFNRLDPLAQQVMQALAVFTVPVPPVAVDYLLQPYRPTVDGAPVLGRLVNMQFVRREAGRYYLHQVDRDYALGKIPLGEPGDREAATPPFTRHALRHRGADYFEQTRTPREGWRTLDDLAPQLSEFELRYQGEDYDSAAAVLSAIDTEYLSLWGHYRLTIELHERVQGRIRDRWNDGRSKSSLGWCYLMLGRAQEAADLYQQAISIYRDVGERDWESAALGDLGLCYRDLGDIEQAIDLLQQAIVIDRETGNRGGEGRAGGNLGLCFHDVGKLDQAIDLHHQGIAIGRETGDRQLEASDLDNLGSCYRDLGQLPEAIAMHKQAAAINRDLGDRYQEAFGLICLANACADLGELTEAAGYGEQAKEMADEITNREVQSSARLALARIRLLDGAMRAAEEAALAVREHPYPASNAKGYLLSGITRLRLGEPKAAAEDFRDAAAIADELLQKTSSAYEQRDTYALALCGLALTTDPALTGQAATAFRAARVITSAAGIVGQVLGLFDALAAADDGGVLAAVRPAAVGETAGEE
jgi:tetratricopeptide (TPR) repeat protein